MPVQTLNLAEPFFSIKIVSGEEADNVDGKVILLNLSETPIRIRGQTLGSLQSVVVADVALQNLAHAVIAERFADHPGEEALFAEVRRTWH